MCWWLDVNRHDHSPPVNPPKEIDDPDDKKPSDWDEREKLAYTEHNNNLSFSLIEFQTHLLWNLMTGKYYLEWS